MAEIKTLTFYLPQYHPIPENDEWWGKGFTEWTNVAKAQPLFKGHIQPRLPADLGFYDLRLEEVRKQQADLARENGIDGFVYYHYWFGNGKRLLERPFNEVLQSGKPDFPFSLCWANQTWSGIWFGASDKILAKQEYPGGKDQAEHFEFLIKAFKDPRYITVEGKPLFIVYDVKDLPNPKQFSEQIRSAVVEAGLPGIHLLASNIISDDWDAIENGFDGKVSNAFNKSLTNLMYPASLADRLKSKAFKYLNAIPGQLRVVDHRKLVDHMKYTNGKGINYPIVVPNWDNTPRSGTRGVVLTQSDSELLEKQVTKSVEFLNKNRFAEKIIFIKSWNEWAEGNYLEPDSLIGHESLRVFKRLKEQSKGMLTKTSNN